MRYPGISISRITWYNSVLQVGISKDTAALISGITTGSDIPVSGFQRFEFKRVIPADSQVILKYACSKLLMGS